jgi:hypothetical protein
MTTEPVPEPLRSYFKTYFHLEGGSGPEWADSIRRSLATNAEQARLFREQFARAIAKETVSLREFRHLTEMDFESPLRLNMHLRDRWEEIYRDEPIPGDE